MDGGVEGNTGSGGRRRNCGHNVIHEKRIKKNLDKQEDLKFSCLLRRSIVPTLYIYIFL